jgi:branched-chain amino acid transport system substrate-binding protein
VVEKFANQHKTDIVYGTLFSHVVIASAPAAGELKIPYYVVSEGHHVASTKLNRYVFQPGITDVKSQIQSTAPWIAANAGKKVTQIFPDFAFGHDHRDYLPPALESAGRGRGRADRHSADGNLLHQIFPADPGRHRRDLPCDGRDRRC